MNKEGKCLQTSTSTPSDKKSVVITEITTPEYEGPTSGVATHPIGSASEDVTLPTEAAEGASPTGNTPNNARDDSQTPSRSTTEQQNVLQEQQQLEDALNAVMGERSGRFRLHFACGDFVKLSGRRALKGAFNVVTVGVMHAHLLRAQHKLGDVLGPGATVLVEGAQNIVQVRFTCVRFCIMPECTQSRTQAANYSYSYSSLCTETTSGASCRHLELG